MKLIKEIKISYFRSFSQNIHIKNINDLNVISGKNDSGKSNILKALNLFFTEDKVDFYNTFNFDRDFFRHRLLDKTSHHRQLIKISILFNKIAYGSKVLPDEFWIEKTWNKDGEFHERKTKNKDGSALKYIRKGDTKESEAEIKSSTTGFLKKIHFLYIPAIKDNRFFDYLKKEYQQSLGTQIPRLSASISSKDTKTLSEWMAQLTTGDVTDLLSQKIDTEAKRMMNHFLGNTSEITESTFAIPELDFSKVLEVITENAIPLTSRGDGVQAKFIPQILNEITRNKKVDIVIWGFEEPENSYEYANAQLLAEKFRDEYSIDKQIFLTSHAFNFISLKGDNSSLYRVWKESFEDGSQVKYIKSQDVLFDNKDSEILKEELGVLQLNRELEILFTEKTKQLAEIDKLKNELDKTILELKKPILYVEDKYDQIYKISWLKVNDVESTQEDFEKLFNELAPFAILKAEGASGLEGFLRATNIDYWKNKKVIGLFDFDETGKKSFDIIKSKTWKRDIQGTLENGYYMQRFDNIDFYCMLMPVSKRLSHLASLDYPSLIEIENLLPEVFLDNKHYAVEKITTGNTKYLAVHSDKKCNLWKDLFTLSNEDFKDFKPLFETVSKLFKL